MADEKTSIDEPVIDPKLVEVLATLDEGKRALVNALIDQLKGEHAQVVVLDGQVLILTNGLEAEKSLRELAQKDLADATGVITGQALTIKELEAKIIELQTKPAAFPVITVDKKNYEVQTKTFKYKKVDYTVEALLKDKKLQKELVEKGVGFLVEKTEG
jgi:hypothetical protein